MNKLYLMQDTINSFLCNKGILAADESPSTIEKRFKSANISYSEEKVKEYRDLLLTTRGLEEYINGVIMHADTFKQVYGDTRLVDLLQSKGILPGIKVDSGLKSMPFTDNEQYTQGIDGLNDKISDYAQKGARFAKWRATFEIDNSKPSNIAIKANMFAMSMYASICQANGIVPIVEPEVLMDGAHDIDQCAEVTTKVLINLFKMLRKFEVNLRLVVLKVNMIVPGKDNKDVNSRDNGVIAKATVSTLMDVVPASIPVIVFLSGGQTPLDSTINLNAINELSGINYRKPWFLSFSYGRALQDECLKAWSGKDENRAKMQQILLEVAKRNAMATLGAYHHTEKKSCCCGHNTCKDKE